jgi:hypothetical protein
VLEQPLAVLLVETRYKLGKAESSVVVVYTVLEIGRSGRQSREVTLSNGWLHMPQWQRICNVLAARGRTKLEQASSIPPK